MAGISLMPSERTIKTQRLQKARAQRAENAKQKALEDLTAEFNAKRNTLLRQAVHADPQLVEAAAERIHAYIVKSRLDEHASAIEAYQKGGMVTAQRSTPSLLRKS